MFFLKVLKNLVQLILNFLFLIQIILMFLVFFTATYWLFSIVGSNVFSFAEPLANSIISVIRIFYTPKAVMNGIVVDSSLLLFDVIAIVTVFIISYCKHFVYRFIDEINSIIEKLRRFDEENFNKALKKEADKKFLKFNKVAILLQIEIEDLFVKKYRNKDLIVRDKTLKEDYAFKILIATLKNFKNCKLAKDNDKMLILLDDFSKVDNVIYFIEQLIVKIQKELKKEHWEINFYISAEVYENSTNIKEDVYPILERLLNLKLKDKVACLGSFNLRYQLKPDPMYYVMLMNSSYAIDGGSDIYILVKKV